MISICMTTYNGEKFIKQQLISILDQICENDEIIISDDNSTDGTLNEIYSLNDYRIKLFINNPPQKPYVFKFFYVTKNIENAIKKCTGDYIYLADQDDLWLPGKIEICQEALIENDLILSDCNIINSNGEKINDSYFSLNNSKPGILKNIFFKNSYLGCCMSFKKELIPFILPISRFFVPHDIWIGLIAEWYGKVFFINKPLVAYRRHDNNVSPSGGKSSNSFWFKFRYRYILLKSFIIRILKLS